MEQEQINIEDIMQEIRAEIRAKGYADNEIPFSDIACLVGGTEVPFDLKDYLDDISMMDESRTVLAYRDISSTRKGVGKLITFVKKVIRKMVCFYVEPLVDDQNRFNELTTRVWHRRSADTMMMMRVLRNLRRRFTSASAVSVNSKKN